MALKLLPGGVVYDDATGKYVNQPQGVNLEAIHRQLGASVAAALDMAERAFARATSVTDEDGQQVDLAAYATRAYVDTKAQEAAQEVAGQAAQAQQTASQAQQAAAQAATVAEAAADSVTTEVALVRSETNNRLDALASVDTALAARVTALEQAPPPTGGGDVDDAAMLAEYLAARG